MTIGVYQIKCVPTGKRYVGSSCNIEARRKSHLSDLRNDSHHNRHLQNSWNKRGEDSFEFSVLKVCELGEEKRYEQHWLDLLRPEFNIAMDARGYEVGHRHGTNARRKISKANKGAKKSLQHRARISESLKGNRNAVGHQLAPDHIAKISFANTGKESATKGVPLSTQHKKKISDALQGRVHSVETRKRMSEAKIGKTFTAAHRAKLSEAQRRRYADAKKQSNINISGADGG